MMFEVSLVTSGVSLVMYVVSLVMLSLVTSD